ncbi:hypothetical protein BH11MYX2_BH11MYX2_00830 [soil metagenome]
MRRACLLVLALVACGDDGANHPSDAPVGDVRPDALGGCATPTGAGTMHTGVLAADEIWTAEGSPHLVTGTITVKGGHTLTIEECAVVQISAGQSIYVGSASPSDGTGTLIAHGTAGSSPGDSFLRPVRITSVSLTSYWGSLVVDATGLLDLDTVVVDRGGDPAVSAGGGGAIVARGDDNRLVPVRNIKAKNVLVAGSATYGINVRTSAGFTTDSGNIEINTSGGSGVVSGGEDSHYAMYIESPSIQTLPTSMTFQANNRDAVLAHDPFTLAVDERFPYIGVPYQLRGDFYMAPSTVSTITLTIDPGVTIKLGGPLASAPTIKLGYGDTAADTHAVRLVAAGTAAKPIKLTSGAATPAAGDWIGIDWQGGPATGNTMSYVTTEYGGASAATSGFGCGPSDNSALVIITDWRPDDAFITNSTFKDSAGGGIVSGWKSDAAGPNLKTGNTFVNLQSACSVTQPRTANNMCPGNDSTPDCY